MTCYCNYVLDKNLRERKEPSFSASPMAETSAGNFAPCDSQIKTPWTRYHPALLNTRYTYMVDKIRPYQHHARRPKAMNCAVSMSVSHQALPEPAPGGTVGRLELAGVFFFSFLAQRRPHALQRVFGPLGPLRHSGESKVPIIVSIHVQVRHRGNLPQSVQTYSSGNLIFFFLSPRNSLSRGIAMPASPLIKVGL